MNIKSLLITAAFLLGCPAQPKPGTVSQINLGGGGGDEGEGEGESEPVCPVCQPHQICDDEEQVCRNRTCDERISQTTCDTNEVPTCFSPNSFSDPICFCGGDFERTSDGLCVRSTEHAARVNCCSCLTSHIGDFGDACVEQTDCPPDEGCWCNNVDCTVASCGPSCVTGNGFDFVCGTLCYGSGQSGGSGSQESTNECVSILDHGGEILTPCIETQCSVYCEGF